MRYYALLEKVIMPLIHQCEYSDMKKKSESVPKSMQDRYAEIISVTNAFSRKHLNEEYAQEIRYVVAILCRKRPSPLVKGKAASWACGVTHAVGIINFLFDSSEKPYIKASDLYKAFGVAESTGQGKSKLVRDLLKMNQLDSNWMLPSRALKSPFAGIINIDGLFVDVRHIPRELQESAFEEGLIPCIPNENMMPSS